jgi:hypothetical protein
VGNEVEIPLESDNAENNPEDMDSILGGDRAFMNQLEDAEPGPKEDSQPTPEKQPKSTYDANEQTQTESEATASA